MGVKSNKYPMILVFYTSQVVSRISSIYSGKRYCGNLWSWCSTKKSDHYHCNNHNNKKRRQQQQQQQKKQTKTTATTTTTATTPAAAAAAAAKKTTATPKHYLHRDQIDKTQQTMTRNWKMKNSSMHQLYYPSRN